jgi:hypothetical protein
MVNPKISIVDIRYPRHLFGIRNERIGWVLAHRI